MIVLDTDHVSVLQWEADSAERLRERLITSNEDWIGVTTVTLEEQCRAAITRLSQCKKSSDQTKYYKRLASIFRFFGKWRFADFDDSSASCFDQLRKECRTLFSTCNDTHPKRTSCEKTSKNRRQFLAGQLTGYSHILEARSSKIAGVQSSN